MMARIAVAMFAVVSMADTLNIRRIDRTVDVSQNSQAPLIEWYKGESIQYNAKLWRGQAAVSTTAGSVPVLKVWASNNLSLLYVNATGTIVSSGGNEARVELTTGQANLPAGTYNSALMIYDGTNYMGVAAYAPVRVTWSPAGDYIAYVGAMSSPWTPFPTNTWTAGYALASSDGGTTTYATAAAGGTTTNVTPANLLANGGAGINSSTFFRGDWGAAASNKAAAAATGTPIYVETDPSWTAASNAYWSAILARATGTPLYVITSNTLYGVDGSGLTNLPSGGGGSGDVTNAVQLTDSRGFTNSGGVAVGQDGVVASAGSLAVGSAARATGLFSCAIGNGGPIASGDGAVALGYGPDARGFAAIALGENAEAGGENSFSIGGSSLAASNRSVAIGYNARATNIDSIVIGNSIVDGFYDTAPSQMVFRADGGYYFRNSPIFGDASGLTNLPITADGATVTKTATGTHISVTGGGQSVAAAMAYGSRAHTQSVVGSSAWTALTNMPLEGYDYGNIYNPTTMTFSLSRGKWALKGVSYFGGAGSIAFRVVGTNGVPFTYVSASSQFTPELQGNGVSAYYAITAVNTNPEVREFTCIITNQSGEAALPQIRWSGASSPIDNIHFEAYKIGGLE